MGKFSRTWRIMGASWRVLKQDKELLMFPVLSGIAAVLVLGSFVLPLAYGETWRLLEADGGNEPLIYAWAFLFYFASYFVIIFFNAALVACALKRMDGGDPTVPYGLGAAWRQSPRIAGWTLVTGTVGLVLRMIEERVGFIGQIVVALLGLTWTVTAYLVVPVLVNEGKGPIEAYKSSVAMLKKSWGEQLIGNVSFALIFGVLAIAPVGVVFLAGMTGSEAAVATAMVFAGAIIVLLVVVQSTLQSIYQAAVYRYAGEGVVPDGFDEQTLAGAFRSRG